METARQQTASIPDPQPAPVVAAAPDPTPARPRRKPFVVLGVIAAIAVGSFGGYRFLTAGRESTDDAQVAADMVPVSARVGGVVARVLIHENQSVRKGDLLI